MKMQNLLKYGLIAFLCGLWIYLISVPVILPFLQRLFGDMLGSAMEYAVDVVTCIFIFKRFEK